MDKPRGYRKHEHYGQGADSQHEVASVYELRGALARVLSGWKLRAYSMPMIKRVLRVVM